MSVASLESSPYGFTFLYCSSIRQLESVQYLKIVLVEFGDNFCRLVSNFAYYGYTINRLYLTGTMDYSKSITLMNELKIKTYMTISILISAGLSLPKVFQFDINLDMPESDFPLLLIQNHFRYGSSRSKVLIPIISISNLINDLIKNFLFIFVNLLLNILLVTKTKDVFEKKTANEKEIKQLNRHRFIRLIIAFSFFNILTRLPLIVINFFSDIYLIRKKPTIQPVFLVTRLANCFFLISLCFTQNFFNKLEQKF